MRKMDEEMIREGEKAGIRVSKTDRDLFLTMRKREKRTN